MQAPMTWSSFDDECKAYAYDKLADIEFLLLGRHTYEMFSARWPDIQNDKYIGRINGLKKLVASKTLKEVTWNASLIAGDVATELADIKRQPGGDIMKYGVNELDRTLLANKLVDEYNLWIMPKYLGRGKRAFQDVDSSLLNLDLIGTHAFRNGSVILNYAQR